MFTHTRGTAVSSSLSVPTKNARLQGDLVMPDSATGLVLFVHGSGSSRFSSRNQFVARELAENGLATLLIDLLTAE
jgi:alpha-beta hydrolase superfamily lysophospholipase